uniref:Transcription factor MYBS3-like n=1 Tax=Tanacetum cinerariifolium TaxID=118510 RepID=A0A699KYV3_TANCI|nr:transcription factor MYBS3-like [Tanacetum cinerariifolium]
MPYNSTTCIGVLWTGEEHRMFLLGSSQDQSSSGKIESHEVLKPTTIHSKSLINVDDVASKKVSITTRFSCGMSLHYTYAFLMSSLVALALLNSLVSTIAS